MSQFYRYFLLKSLQWFCLVGILAGFLVLIISIREDHSRMANWPIFSTLLSQSDITKKQSQIAEVNSQIPSFKEFNDSIESKSTSPLPGKYLKYYQKMVTAFPEMSEGYSLLGYCQYNNGNVKAALEAYQKAVELSSENFWNYYNLAILLRQQGQQESSVYFLNKAVKIDPQRTTEFITNAIVYRQLMVKDFNYNIGESLRKGYAKAYFILGQEYEILGNHILAEQSFSRSKEFLPQNELKDVGYNVQVF